MKIHLREKSLLRREEEKETGNATGEEENYVDRVIGGDQGHHRGGSIDRVTPIKMNHERNFSHPFGSPLLGFAGTTSPFNKNHDGI
jgi:hypothetical protein